MGIISSIGNIYFTYQFLKKLVVPFESTDAFKLGIIDDKGNILIKRNNLKTSEEKKAYTISDTLIWNLKKLMAKIPGGGSKIATFGAALFLLKEQDNNEMYSNKQQLLEDNFKEFLDNLDTESINESIDNSTVIEILELCAFNPNATEIVETLHEKFDLNNEQISSLGIFHVLKDKINDDFYYYMTEEAPANNVGDGNIDMPTIPLMPSGVKKSMFANMDVFCVGKDQFQKSIHGKKRYDRYHHYVGTGEVGDYIKNYCKNNPKKSILVKDDSTGMMQYLRKK